MTTEFADPSSFQKLKPGPSLPADEVLADQRRRLHGAMISVIGSSGWESVRVRSVARTAGVSTATFYKHFANVEDCLGSTYEAVMASAVRDSTAAQGQRSTWRDGLRSAVATLLVSLGRNESAARLALYDIFTAGPSARKRIGPGVGELEDLIASSFIRAPRPERPPRHLVTGMTAGLVRVVRTTTMAGRGSELSQFAEELADWMVSLPSSEILSLRPMAARATKVAIGLEDGQPLGRSPCADDRARLLRAAVRLASRDGIATLTGPRLRADAGVSRQRFDACFTDIESCLLAATESLVEEAGRRASTWSTASRDWERRTCRFVMAVCEQAACQRREAHLAFIGMLGIGSEGLLRRERMVSRSAAGLCSTVPGSRKPSPIAAEASIAAAWRIAQSDVASGRARRLPSVAPLLSYVVLAPIIGARTASEAIHEEIGSPDGPR